ncbi:hypothetical protein AB5I41_05520 [Sphingomonas sp. MMS24-JH45]
MGALSHRAERGRRYPPRGNCPDPLLLNVGQTQRPDRRWWRMVLDQYGGLDVVMPTARLYRQWPGGPVIGVFQARHGPDNRVLEQFAMRVGNARGLPALLDRAVARLDGIYQQALRGGYLGVDPGLNPPVPTPTPTATPIPGVDNVAALLGAETATTITVQFDLPMRARCSPPKARCARCRGGTGRHHQPRARRHLADAGRLCGYARRLPCRVAGARVAGVRHWGDDPHPPRAAIAAARAATRYAAERVGARDEPDRASAGRLLMRATRSSSSRPRMRRRRGRWSIGRAGR